MNLSGKIARNTAIQMVSKVLTTLLGLFVLSVLTRELGRDGFGEYSIVMAFLSFFAIAGDMGLTLITSQMLSENKAEQMKNLNNLFSFRLVTALFFLGMAPIAVIFFPYSSDVKIGVAITSISFFCIALNQIFVGFFQYKLRMDKVSIAEVAGRMFLVLGVLYAVYYNYGLIAVLIATMLANVVSFLFHFYFARKIVKIKLDFDFNVWRKIIKKSWPIAITIGLNLIYLKGDLLVLSFVRPSEDVGIYGAAYKVIDVLVMIPFIFAGISLPILSKNWINDKKSFNRILQRMVDFMIIISIPLLVGGQFMSKSIMKTVAGSEFVMSGSVLQILVLACVAIFFGTMFSHVIIAINRQKKTIFAYVFVSITSVIGYIIFIPKFSYIGASWMTVYSEVIIALFSFYYVKKYTDFSYNLKIFFKVLFSVGMMAIVLYLIPEYYYSGKAGLILVFMLVSIVYFASLYSVGGITKEDVKAML